MFLFPIATAHEKIKLPKVRLNCDSCEKTFSSKQRLRTHIAAIHEGKKLADTTVRIDCSFCDKSFSSRQRLNSHIISIHEGKKPSSTKLKCSFCDQTFASKQRLKGHIATVHEGKKEIMNYKWPTKVNYEEYDFHESENNEFTATGVKNPKIDSHVLQPYFLKESNEVIPSENENTPYHQIPPEIASNYEKSAYAANNESTLPTEEKIILYPHSS